MKTWYEKVYGMSAPTGPNESKPIVAVKKREAVEYKSFSKKYYSNKKYKRKPTLNPEITKSPFTTTKDAIAFIKLLKKTG